MRRKLALFIMATAMFLGCASVNTGRIEATKILKTCSDIDFTLDSPQAKGAELFLKDCRANHKEGDPSCEWVLCSIVRLPWERQICKSETGFPVSPI